MSNEVIARRCRRSPTGIEDCFGSTGGTGSTGAGGFDLVGGQGDELTLGPDESGEVVAASITLEEDGEIGIWFSTNQVVTGAGAGAQRFTYVVSVDGTPILAPPRIMESPNDVTVSTADNHVVAATAGTHTVSVEVTYGGGAGTATVDSGRLNLLAA